MNVRGDAKSVLSVLGACIKCGDELELVCQGEDEEEALKGMIDIIESLHTCFRLISVDAFTLYKVAPRFPSKCLISARISQSTNLPLF